MENLKLFEYCNNEVRVVFKNEEPWFVAKDVCNILEISNSRDALSRLNSNMKDVATTDTLGGNQDMSIVSEAGVYKLVFTSRKPEAEKFTDWLAEEVIPSIRKHGMYATDELVNNPDLLIQVATQLKKEREEKRLLQIENEEKQAKIEADKPKVEFADTISDIDDGIEIGEYAKSLYDKNGINVGRNRLFQWFRNKGYLMDDNIPYQQFMKYFKVKEYIYNKHGVDRFAFKTYVNGKGQLYFFNKIKDFFGVVKN